MNCPQGCFKKHVFGHFWIFLGKIQKNVFYKSYAEFQYGHFKLSPRSLRLKMWLGELQFFQFSMNCPQGCFKNTFLGIFEFFWAKLKKMYFTKVMRNFATVILSYLRGRYDLRCEWCPENNKISLKSLGQPRRSHGGGLIVKID